MGAAAAVHRPPSRRRPTKLTHPIHLTSERRRARDAVAAAAAAGAAKLDADFVYDQDEEGGPPPSALDTALGALASRQAAARSRGLQTLHMALRAGYRPDAADRPLSTIAALKDVLGKRGGSGEDVALAASCVALAFLQAGPSSDALSAYESIAPTLATMAGSVKGGLPGVRAAACTALAVGAFVVGDAGGPDVVDAAEALATAAVSRVLAGPAAVGVGSKGDAPAAQPPQPPLAASTVAAAALRGLALLATALWPSQAAGLASDGRVLRALSGALASSDVDVRHAAGLAAVALRTASGRGGRGRGSVSSSSASSGEEAPEEGVGGHGARLAAHAALGPALARVRGLASSSHAALDRLGGGGSVAASGAATPTGRGGAGMGVGPAGALRPPLPPPSSTAFRSGNGLRLSRAARTEQRRLFRGLEVVGCGNGGTAEIRSAVLKKVAGPAWAELVAEGWLGGLCGGGARGGGWGAGASRGTARAREKERAKGRAGAASDRVACLAGTESEGW